MFGVWWSATDKDVRDIGEAAKGYSGLILTGPGGRVLDDIKKYVPDNHNEIGTVLYNRGIVAAALSVEAIRRAQTRFGKGKVMNGEQIRWGMENLALDKKALTSLGLSTIMQPISTSCVDHSGSNSVRLHTWDGAKWNYITDWIEADMSIIKPMIKQQADKYAAEKKITRRTPADCQS
jgi:branched-chain amino acid transport system substrate-binding protein